MNSEQLVKRKAKIDSRSDNSLVRQSRFRKCKHPQYNRPNGAGRILTIESKCKTLISGR